MRALALQCKEAVAKARAHLEIPVPNLPKQMVERALWKRRAAKIHVGRKLEVSVMTRPWRWHTQWSRLQNHTLQWRSTRKVSHTRDSEDDPRRTFGEVRGHQNTLLDVLAAMDAATGT